MTETLSRWRREPRPPAGQAAVRPAAATQLSTLRGAALYIGALLGPGLLMLPGLAAAEAGPASVVAWTGLLLLSALFALVFTALGRSFPSAGGVTGYVTAGLGPRLHDRRRPGAARQGTLGRLPRWTRCPRHARLLRLGTHGPRRHRSRDRVPTP